MKCIRCIVSGRVQGVFFRRSAQREAEALGVSGWARNLPDGRVEVLACGEPAALEAMQRWLRQGPPQAAVSDVACDGHDQPPDLSGFDVC
jgi:acylphosphatase